MDDIQQTITLMKDNTLLKIIGQRIVNIRKQKNISQEKLAELSDLHRTYISDVENGKRNLTISVLYRICCGLNISLSHLLKGIKK